MWKTVNLSWNKWLKLLLFIMHCGSRFISLHSDPIYEIEYSWQRQMVCIRNYWLKPHLPQEWPIKVKSLKNA